MGGGFSCQAAAKLRDSTFIWVTIIKLPFCSLGIVLSVVFIFKKGISWVGHPNAKLIFFFHCLWTVLTPVSCLIYIIYEIQRLIPYHPNPCDYLIPPVQSFFLRLPMLITILGQTMTMFAFSIERTISTLFPEKYEKQKSMVPAACALAFLYTITYVYLYFTIISPNKFETETIAATIFYKNYNTTSTFVFSLVETTTILLFSLCLVVTLFRLKRIGRTKTANLGLKYQLTENRKIIVSLLPCFLVHFVFYAATSCGMFLVTSFVPLGDLATITIMAEFINQVYLYSVFLPLIVFLQEKCGKKTAVVNVEGPGDEHFNRLERFWESQRRLQ